jgi:cation diffusion facilitator family transporter
MTRHHESDHLHAPDHEEHRHARDAPTSLSRAVVGLVKHEHEPDLAPSDIAIRAVWLSLVILGATSVLQAAVAWTSGSVALLADTVHNAADALTALPLWLAYVAGRRLANDRYTYGYGRAEDLAGLAVVAMIALSIAVTVFQAVERFIHPRELEALGWVAVAGVVGVIGNEAAALMRIRAGRRISSAALVADGEHARGDGISSAGVVLSAGGVAAGFPLADPIVGLGISFVLLFILRSATVRMYHRLMDAVDPSLRARAIAILRSTSRVESVGDVTLRWVGHKLWGEARIVVDCDVRFSDAHAVAVEAEHALLHEIPELESVSVHVDPCDHAGLDPHSVMAHHRRHAG